MNIKRLLIVTLSCVIFTFVVGTILSLIFIKVPELVGATVMRYRFLTFLQIYLKLLPGIFSTGVLISFSLEFGATSNHTTARFSPVMFDRLRMVIFTSLVIALILTLVDEVVLPAIDRKMIQYRKLPSLIEEYKDFSQTLYETDRYSLSYEVAKKAYTLSPKDTGAKFLMDRAEAMISNERITSLRNESTGKTRGRYSKSEIKDDDDKVATDKAGTASDKAGTASDKAGTATDHALATQKENTDPTRLLTIVDEMGNPYTPKRLRDLANGYFKDADYFNAHYYSQLYLKAVGGRDVHYKEMQIQSSEAWNALETIMKSKESADNLLFKMKMEGYNALMQGDNVKAYYIFHGLAQKDRAMAMDPDISRYLQIAQRQMLEDYFFSDETLNIAHFETSNDVFFKITNSDNSVDVFYIKGITNAIEKSELILYLRGLCIIHLDDGDRYVSGRFFPYAKLTSLDTTDFSEEERQSLGLSPDTHYVPYLQLSSVDRNNASIITSAVYFKGQPVATPRTLGNSHASELHLVIPMELSEFNQIRSVSGGVEAMNIASLYEFIPIAQKYGYPADMFSQELLNRILYPLFVLIALVFVAIIAWQGRLDTPSGIFKFKWVTVFPLFFVFFIAMFYFLRALYKLVNYNLFNRLDSPYSFLVGFGTYAIFFVATCIAFLSCHESNEVDRVLEDY